MADGLIEVDSDGKAEADGLPVPVMDRLLLDRIDELQDSARRDEVVDRELDERDEALRLVVEALASEEAS